MPPDPSDTAPVSADAFAAIYTAHRSAIVRYLRRRLGDDAAEDAAAEVFARAFRRFPDFRDEHGTPLPWLYGIAAHVISERSRAERRRLRLMARVAREAHPGGASGDHPGASDRAGASTFEGLDPTLLTLLGKLKPADRETLLLLAWGELSYAEVATAQEIPIGTVRSRMARVRAILGDHAPTPSPLTPTSSATTTTGDAHV